MFPRKFTLYPVVSGFRVFVASGCWHRLSALRRDFGVEGLRDAGVKGLGVQGWECSAGFEGSKGLRVRDLVP